jgi:L-fucose isomerase-like protein
VKMGLSTCMAFSQLNDSGFICSCEGDVPGAISMMMLDDLSGKHPMIMDMVALDEKEDAITFWHCGMGMPSYVDKNGYCFIKYPAYPEILNEPGVAVDMKFAPQVATICRLNGADAGTLLAATANIVPGPDRSFDGARGWFSDFSMQGRKLSAVEFFDTVMRWGIAHHYVITSGLVETALLETAHRLGIEVATAKPYAHHM